MEKLSVFVKCNFIAFIIITIAIGNCSGYKQQSIFDQLLNKDNSPAFTRTSPNNFWHPVLNKIDTPLNIATFDDDNRDAFKWNVQELFESQASKRKGYEYKLENVGYGGKKSDNAYNFNIKKSFESHTSNKYVYQANNDEYKKDYNIFDKDEIVEDRSASRNLNMSNYSGERCKRVCKEGENFICYFEFTLEFYQAMGIACGKCSQGVEEDCNNPECIVGDGWNKGVMSINRKSPGPQIHVCKDDVIVVDVHNNAHGTSAALHWHGVHMVDTPYMDGVPFVTQCPIAYSNTFRYKFYATQAGTHFYHSHAGHHKTNGQQGVLIIRQPEELEPISYLYDYDLPEYHIFLSDWMHAYAEHHFPGLGSEGIFPDAVIINGRGVFTNVNTKERTKVRPIVYPVIPGKRYRFRLINGINHVCPFQMQIEKHNFTIVASDSFPVAPKVFDTLISNAGERYDFVLEANYDEGDFWLRIRGLGVCTARYIESYALIRYTTNQQAKDNLPIPPFPHYNATYPEVRLFNHPNGTWPLGKTNERITDLLAFRGDEELRTAKPDHKFFLAFNNYVIPNKEIFNAGHYHHFVNIISNVSIVAGINNISFVFPAYVPLTEPELIDESHFCDKNNKPAECVGEQLCHCVHRLKVKLNSTVELIIVDETDAVNRVNHPFHLHGYRFMVTGMGQRPKHGPMTIGRARQMEENHTLLRHSNPTPPFKDTVSIPSRGYVILRFRATNPGFWLMHCHYEWHLAIGMGLMLQVGEVSEMVKPPEDFPKCGNYVPPVRSSDLKSNSRKRSSTVPKHNLYFA